MALLLASLKGHCPLVKLFIGVGNLKPKLKCFFKPKLKPKFFFIVLPPCRAARGLTRSGTFPGWRVSGESAESCPSTRRPTGSTSTTMMLEMKGFGFRFIPRFLGTAVFKISEKPRNRTTASLKPRCWGMTRIRYKVCPTGSVIPRPGCLFEELCICFYVC